MLNRLASEFDLKPSCWAVSHLLLQVLQVPLILDGMPRVLWVVAMLQVINFYAVYFVIYSGRGSQVVIRLCLFWLGFRFPFYMVYTCLYVSSATLQYLFFFFGGKNRLAYQNKKKVYSLLSVLCDKVRHWCFSLLA